MHATAFAEALYRTIDAAPEGTHGEIVERLKAALARRGMSKLYPDIVRAYERLVAGRSRAFTHLVVFADERDVARHRESIKHDKFALGAPESAFQVAVNPRLIGGYRIESDDRQLDRSYQRALVDLYRELAS